MNHYFSRSLLLAILSVAIIATEALADKPVADSAADQPAAKKPAAKKPASIAPIKPVLGLKFKFALVAKPLIFKSIKDATDHFSKEDIVKLKKQVDFSKQIVLVITWRGSGRDQLTYTVSESFPEQVTFNLKRGRTKDFRRHIYIYALRSNVKWSAPQMFPEVQMK